VSDPTGTPAGHPALVTATGVAAPDPEPRDATGTDARHPAIVTRLAPEEAPPATGR
jgi:hypothetical protein